MITHYGTHIVGNNVELVKYRYNIYDKGNRFINKCVYSGFGTKRKQGKGELLGWIYV